MRILSDGTGSPNDDQDVAREAVVTETIKVVSSSLLGLTVGCAQCHDHRYDPISQRDYYRMRAIFEPSLNPQTWLPPKARDNLFRPFFGSARPGGSGLGLAIARELMRAHGGELTLVSSTGSGTFFRLTLPAPARELSRAPMSLP